MRHCIFFVAVPLCIIRVFLSFHLSLYRSGRSLCAKQRSAMHFQPLIQSCFSSALGTPLHSSGTGVALFRVCTLYSINSISKLFNSGYTPTLTHSYVYIFISLIQFMAATPVTSRRTLHTRPSAPAAAGSPQLLGMIHSVREKRQSACGAHVGGRWAGTCCRSCIFTTVFRVPDLLFSSLCFLQNAHPKPARLCRRCRYRSF
jgi:hypothetical protein